MVEELAKDHGRKLMEENLIKNSKTFRMFSFRTVQLFVFTLLWQCADFSVKL
jgi:hypothetical protein